MRRRKKEKKTPNPDAVAREAESSRDKNRNRERKKGKKDIISYMPQMHFSDSGAERNSWLTRLGRVVVGLFPNIEETKQHRTVL